MEIPLKILIVEDEMLIAANLAMQLESFGYEIVGIFPRGEDAINATKIDKPDLDGHQLERRIGRYRDSHQNAARKSDAHHLSYC